MSATRNPWAAVQRLIDKALAGYCPHRVGELYITMTDADPSKTWPGTSWERITDCFLRAADDEHPAGTTGGVWEHMIQTVETPDDFWSGGYGINTQTGTPQVKINKWGWYFENGVLKNASKEMNMLGAGLGSFRDFKQHAMDITNKYTAVYMWRRTA